MQRLVINSFYSQFEKEPDDGDITLLYEVDLGANMKVTNFFSSKYIMD